MIKPIKFKQANKKFTREVKFRGRKSTEAVFLYTNGASSVICLHVSFIDRIRVLFGAPVWLIAKGGAPIVDFETENPFVKTYK